MDEERDSVDDFLSDLDACASFLVRVLVLLAVIALLSFLFCASLESAPAPFPKPQKPPEVLRGDRMVGKWTMHWGGSAFEVVLASGGGYSCSSSTAGIVWRGTWHVRGGKLWVTESARPEEADSWKTFACPLGVSTLEGVIDEGDYQNVRIRLER